MNRVAGLALLLGLGFGIAGCTKIETNTFRLPEFSDLRLPSMAAPVTVEDRRPVPAEELVDSEGRCASTPMAAVPSETVGNDPVTMPSNPAAATGGVGLGMTECDVVKRAGPPEQVTIGANERSERTLTLTYIKSMRPGIYGFVAGRLVSIERAPEPPAPPKPVRPARPAKPKPKPAAT